LNYSPPTGGFSVSLPHQPLLLKDNNYGTDRLEYSAFDKSDKNSYLIMKMNIHNYGFIEEDSFDLNLMDESYGYSSFIEKQLSHQFTKAGNYPALLSKWKHRDGSYSAVKYVIQGGIYYAAAVHYKNENPNVQKFLESFSIKPFVYPAEKLRVDTSLHITVMSPVYPELKKETENIFNMYRRYYVNDDEDEDPDNSLDFETKMIGNDTIGEKIFVLYKAPGKYSFINDSVKYWKKLFNGKSFLDEGEDTDDEDSSHKSTFITRFDKVYNLPGGIKCRELQLTDTGSSRLLWTKFLYKDGHFFSINTLTDSLSVNSPFLQRFFSTLTPSDSLKGEQMFTRKTEKFFNDFFSGDSATAKKARRSLYEVSFDSVDVSLLKKAIYRMNWDMKNYLETKKHFISELAGLKDTTISDFLRDLYFKVGDTAELQNEILDGLLAARTKKSFATFNDLILKEPPVSVNSSSYDYSYSFTVRNMLRNNPMFRRLPGYSSRFGGAWADLYDTLELTKTIFPEFLQMMNLDEYKEKVIRLMTVMVDSGFLKASDYESYFNKIFMDARQILKKQIAKEDEHNIDVATRKKDDRDYDEEDAEEDKLDSGNSKLENYSILLMPFYDRDNVKNFFAQLLKSRDQQLLYNTFILMLRHKKPVPDSLFVFFAKPVDYRSTLYEDLQELKMLDKFPAAYKNQLDMARSMLRTGNYYSSSKPDSVVYLDKLPVTYKGKTGWVYFFKYKKMRDDNYWQIASVGMQPQKLDSIDIDNDDFTEGENRRLENNQPVSEQLQKMLKELLNAKRSGASEFYEARNYSLYKDYLPEMVKRERYRD
jgi:hypothetical protein